MNPGVDYPAVCTADPEPDISLLLENRNPAGTPREGGCDSAADHAGADNGDIILGI